MKHLLFGKPLLILVSLLVLAGLAACAQPAPSPAPAPAPAPKTGAALTTDQSRQQALNDLYTAAKAEGEVLWQTVTAVSAFQPLVDGFTKRFPGVKLSAFNVNATEMPARIITEAAAKKLTVDVAGGKTTYMSSLFDRDLLFGAGYDWQKVSEIAPASIIYDGRLTVLFDAAPVFVYNNKTVFANDVPKTFQDLLAPRWKGRKIGVTTTGQFAQFLFPQWQKDRQAVLDAMAKLRQQDPFVGSTGTDLVNRVAAGEIQIAWTPATAIPPFLQKGAPVAVSSIGPSYDAPVGLYIPKNSPHPNAAKLLVAWLGSREANAIWLQTSFTASTEGTQGKLLKDAGVKFIRLNTSQEAKDITDLNTAAAKAAGVVPQK